jgi:ferredoxin
MIVEVDDRCSGCGSCLATCPTGALTPARHHPVVDPDRCTGCLACIEVCPVDAISGSGRR